jgi:hypothetical protein
MAGTFSMDGPILRFRPRFAFAAGTSYAWITRQPPVRPALVLSRPALSRAATTVVTGIYPTAAELPVNALRFYLHFSAPMSEGFAATAVQLRDSDSGEALAGAILPMEPELWDPGRSRLTLLLDPGRIKRGLVPHSEAGYPLTPGRHVSLVVDPAFPDATGTPLTARAVREYTVGSAIRQRVSPDGWRIDHPETGTRRPVRVHFDRPMDHALGQRCLTVVDAAGRRVAGASTVAAGERDWTFTPATGWADEQYVLLVAPQLEDIAGNSVTRVFDRDLTDPDHDPRPRGVIRLTLTSQSRGTCSQAGPASAKGCGLA